MFRLQICILVGLGLLAACGGDDGIESPLDPNVAPVTDGDWKRTPASATWQWQLQGTINASYDVDVYDIDLFNVDVSVIASLKAAGRTVICYFSAGSYEGFREDAGEFTESDYGNVLEGFENENWLDVRSSNVHRIMEARLDLAQSKGCDGVEPDNVDGYANDTGFSLSETDQIAFNRFIANEAHNRGLTVGLKNDLDQIPDLLAYFDFVLNEQCHEYDECSLLGPFASADKAVFVAEYLQTYVDDSSARDAMCQDSRQRDFRALVLPLDLDDRFRYACDP